MGNKFLAYDGNGVPKPAYDATIQNYHASFWSNGPAKVADFPGVTGYLSTPDSPAADINPVIIITAKLTADDWTPAAQMAIVSKYISGGQKSYLLTIEPSGNLKGWASADGSTTVDATSSAATGFTAGTTHWVKLIILTVSNLMAFETSEDGVTWTPLGVPQTAVLAGLHIGTAPVIVGAYDTIGIWPFAGTIHEVNLIDAATEAVVVKCNPDEYTGGTTWTSSTGEVWTIGGDVAIQ